MDKFEIIIVSMVVFFLSALGFILIGEFYAYEHTYTDIKDVTAGSYYILNGTIVSYLGESSKERLYCAKGCFTTYKHGYVYIVYTQGTNISVIFNEIQLLNNTINLEVSVHENYFEE